MEIGADSRFCAICGTPVHAGVPRLVVSFAEHGPTEAFAVPWAVGPRPSSGLAAVGSVVGSISGLAASIAALPLINPRLAYVFGLPTAGAVGGAVAGIVATSIARSGYKAVRTSLGGLAGVVVGVAVVLLVNPTTHGALVMVVGGAGIALIAPASILVARNDRRVAAPPGHGPPLPHAFGYASPYGYGPPRTAGMAVASMVLGILGFWVLALVFGYVGKGQVDRSQGTLQGRGMAIAGIVLGWVGFAVSLALVVMIASLASAPRS